MMPDTPHDLPALRRLASQGEGLHLEFKRKFPDPAKLMREVAAFANTAGGLLLLGVEDDGEVFGLKDPLEAEEAFQLAVEKWLHPQVEYRLSQVEITPKRSVVVVRIPASADMPHVVRQEPGQEKGTATVRVEDRSITASREIWQILRHRAAPKDVKVEYGEKESKLMKYLDGHRFVTVEEFAQAAEIKRNVASRTLVHLVRADVLRVEADEQADRYFLKF